MGAEFYKGTRLDSMTDRELCCNCFDGRHYFRWSSKKFEPNGTPMKELVDSPRGSHSNCLQGKCECPCLRLMIEKPVVVTRKEKRKVQAELQQTISTENVLVFRKGESEPTMENAKP